MSAVIKRSLPSFLRQYTISSFSLSTQHPNLSFSRIVGLPFSNLDRPIHSTQVIMINVQSNLGSSYRKGRAENYGGFVLSKCSSEIGLPNENSTYRGFVDGLVLNFAIQSLLHLGVTKPPAFLRNIERPMLTSLFQCFFCFHNLIYTRGFEF